MAGLLRVPAPAPAVWRCVPTEPDGASARLVSSCPMAVVDTVAAEAGAAPAVGPLVLAAGVAHVGG